MQYNGTVTKYYDEAKAREREREREREYTITTATSIAKRVVSPPGNWTFSSFNWPFDGSAPVIITYYTLCALQRVYNKRFAGTRRRVQKILVSFFFCFLDSTHRAPPLKLATSVLVNPLLRIYLNSFPKYCSLRKPTI